MTWGAVDMCRKRYPEEFRIEAVKHMVDRDHTWPMWPVDWEKQPTVCTRAISSTGQIKLNTKIFPNKKRRNSSHDLSSPIECDV